MATNGYITFYTTRESDPRTLIRSTFAALTNARPRYGWRTIGEDRSWAELSAFLAGDESSDPTGADKIEVFQRGEDWPGDPESRFIDGTSLAIVIKSDDWAELDAGLRRDIPEATAGGCYPSSPTVQVGWHDLFGDTPRGENEYIARPWYSVHLQGLGTPHDWARFPELAFSVPEVRALKSKLEAFAGPLEQCFYCEGL